MDERRLREIQELVGHKWDLRVLLHLHEEPRRYMELVKEIRAGEEAISERVLSETLKRLRSCGLVTRENEGLHGSPYAPTLRGRHIARLTLLMISEVGSTVE